MKRIEAIFRPERLDNVIAALHEATADASARSSGSSRRHLSSWTSALIAVRLATSPAAAPPTPSATAASRGLA